MYGKWLRRVPNAHRYRVTEAGGRTALFCTRCDNRLLRPGLAQLAEESEDSPPEWRRCFDAVDAALERRCNREKVPA